MVYTRYMMNFIRGEGNFHLVTLKRAFSIPTRDVLDCFAHGFDHFPGLAGFQ